MLNRSFDAAENFKTLRNPPSYKFETIPCYLCGSKSSEFFVVGEEDLTGKDGEFQYVKCSDCELVFQNPRVHPEQIKTFYDNEYIAHRKKTDWGVLTPLYERAMNKHDRDKAKLVSHYVKLNSDSRILDVGCAVGTFLLHMKDTTGAKISGVDFKENLTFPRFGEIDFHCGLFYEQALPKNHFDLITMWHFLEHCYSPLDSLRMAAECVTDEGRIVVEVPRLDSVSFKLFGRKWPGVQAPKHTVLFDRARLIETAEAAGLEVVDYLPYGAFPPYFYLFAGSYFRMIGKGLKLDKIIAPYFLGQTLLTPVLMAQKRLNLAMQTVVLRRPSGAKQ